jgi:signal recognition particle subunit SRP54
MFDSLSNRLQDVFRTLRGEARLSESAVESALREIRMALLEADVNFKVVKAFVDRVRERAVGQEVLRSLTPAQHVVKIVRDELVARPSSS